MSAKNKPTVKQKVLLALEDSRGVAVSGEGLATELSVSRAAVWKAIQALRSEGYPITASTNKGYILDDGSDLLSAQGMAPYLNPEEYPDPVARIHTFKTLGSTNKTAKQMALAGAESGTVVLSEEQTAGRGRMGRSFFSPAEKGLYMSYILRPSFDTGKALLVTTAASVAVCRAVKSIAGVETQIKWVNDIFLGGKKICGILTEAISNFESGRIDAIIVGIGINCSVQNQEFPEELQRTAGSLSGDVPRNKLAAEIINHLCELFDNFGKEPYPRFMDEYRGRSMVLRKDIDVYQSFEPEAVPKRAKAVDVSDEGGLSVIYEDGTKDILTTGEITIRMV